VNRPGGAHMGPEGRQSVPHVMGRTSIVWRASVARDALVEIATV
jgi:hypothetical protein